MNPELELLRFFAEHGFENVPRARGLVVVHRARSSTRSLGIVQGFVPGAVDGWALALESSPPSPDAFLAARAGSGR